MAPTLAGGETCCIRLSGLLIHGTASEGLRMAARSVRTQLQATLAPPACMHACRIGMGSWRRWQRAATRPPAGALRAATVRGPHRCPTPAGRASTCSRRAAWQRWCRSCSSRRRAGHPSLHRRQAAARALMHAALNGCVHGQWVRRALWLSPKAAGGCLFSTPPLPATSAPFEHACGVRLFSRKSPQVQRTHVCIDTPSHWPVCQCVCGGGWVGGELAAFCLPACTRTGGRAAAGSAALPASHRPARPSAGGARRAGAAGRHVCSKGGVG